MRLWLILKGLRDSWLNIKRLWLTLKDYDSIPFWIDMNRSRIDIIDTMEY